MVIEAFRFSIARGRRTRSRDLGDWRKHNSRSRARDFIHDEKIRLGISLVARVNHGYPVTDPGAVGSIQTN
jgi:hypothetical protein